LGWLFYVLYIATYKENLTLASLPKLALRKETMTLKKLPLGSKAFSQIINRNYLYADKTQYIYKLLQRLGGSYFLSRPRRFGKTLLLNTIHELFTDNRSLF
jgi:hypothetical protein